MGLGTLDDVAEPALVMSDAIAVAPSVYHTCALRADHRVLCWGSNEAGQLGDGTTTQRLTPVEVAAPEGHDPLEAATIGVGDWHACATDLEGTLWCWGANFLGQLGNGVVSDDLVPAPALASSVQVPVAGVTGGEVHTCALTQAGEVLCWGSDDQGEVGDGMETLEGQPNASPVDVCGAKLPGPDDCAE